MMTNLAEDILLNAGYSINKGLLQDGNLHRFGSDNAQWYVCYENYLVAGDWQGNLPEIKQFIDSNNGNKNLSNEWLRGLSDKVETAKKEREEALENQHIEASNEASRLWNNLSSSGHSLYLTRKGLSEVEGIKFGCDDKGVFIVTALTDNLGKIWTLQFIYDKPFNKNQNKLFLKGGNKSGCYTKFGNENSDLIYLCEGVATALSILLAKPESLVIVAYDCGNLKQVTQNILIKYHSKKVVIAGDNDLTKPRNIGKEKAEEVAKEFSLEVVLPSFKDVSDKSSDFNDLYQLEGIEEVKRQLSNLTSSDDLIEWDSPIMFDEYETPEITSDILPSPLKEFSQELANSTETPEGMSVMVILSALSTSLQGKFEVKPKEDSSYSETVNIYTITTLPPANRKSSVLNACIAPLSEWEKEQREIMEPEIKRQKSRYESEKGLIDKMRKKLKSGDSSGVSIEEIANKEAELKEPESLPRLFVNDITPESLVTLMSPSQI